MDGAAGALSALAGGRLRNLVWGRPCRPSGTLIVGVLGCDWQVGGRRVGSAGAQGACGAGLPGTAGTT